MLIIAFASFASFFEKSFLFFYVSFFAYFIHCLLIIPFILISNQMSQLHELVSCRNFRVHAVPYSQIMNGRMWYKI